MTPRSPRFFTVLPVFFLAHLAHLAAFALAAGGNAVDKDGRLASIWRVRVGD